MKSPKFLVLLLLTLLGCSQIKTKPITEVSQKDIKSGILIDVRTPKEFKEGYLESAVNINWFDTDFAEQFDTIGKKKAIYLYCKVGGRSAKAAKLLDSLGYKNVTNLSGGYLEYIKSKN